MRQFFSIVVPLLLPTVLYFLYMTTMRRRSTTAGGKGVWEEVPWTWLGLAGAFLMAVTIGAFALFDGAEPGSEYRPPRLIDGKIEPGGFVE
jgi:hypothetical protein